MLCYVKPEADQQLIRDKLTLTLPPQPSPRICPAEAALPTGTYPCGADL